MLLTSIIGSQNINLLDSNNFEISGQLCALDVSVGIEIGNGFFVSNYLI
jgi:hypothetical protein